MTGVANVSTMTYMTNTTQACRKCGFPEADVIDSEGTPLCRIHQHLAVGEKTTTYEVRSDFPSVVEYVR